MLIPTSPSLSSTLELVTTTHIPTRSPRPPPSLEPSTTTANPTTRTSDLARDPEQLHVSNINLKSTSVTPSESPQHWRNFTSKPTSFEDSTTHRSTHRARNSTRLHPAKRRSPKTNRTSRSSTSEVEPLGLPAKKSARVDPYKGVCSNDPCGPGIACHPTPDGEYAFECICSEDESRIRPGGTCSTYPLESEPPARAIESEVNKATKNFVGFAAVVGTLVVMVLLLLVYWRRKSFYSITRHRKGEKKSTQQQSPGALAKSSSLLTYNFASNPNYYAQSPDNLPLHTLAVQLIDSEQITFIGELGEGCFGKVYKGTYGPRCPENVGVVEGGTSTTLNLTVAVKVLKECAGVEAEADFLREVEIMSAFRHENILSLIGIVATETGGTPWMVFEYMPYGDLAEVLRSCNKQFYSNDSPIKSLSKEDLLNISVQIASGMEYLSSQHFVHRDLACRNCLVGDKLTVKISDFGMSRDVYTCDYYKVGGSRMLPVRWMAHESIMYGKFTLESDVWSFGVVLWEIYSFGKQPYYGNSNENVVKLIFQGILLSPPDTCPPQVCDVMRRCWATDPNDRLKFPEILSQLKRLQQEQKGSSSPSSSPAAPITYSELCPQDEGGLQLDSDQYLMPRKAEYREYLTVLNDV